MNLNSPLFDSIRIKPADDPVAKPDERRCEHKGCANAGRYRAPKGRNNDGQFWRFCLEHVRAYNSTYNYFKDMDDESISAYQKDALTGHRPTWTMGQNAAPARERRRARATRPEDFVWNDPHGTFGLGGFDPRRRRAPIDEGPAIGNAARKSYETLGVEPGAPKEEIRARYKELVKRLHPDTNGGDRSREDQLQAVLRAYKTLQAAKLV
ncbi:J domain-containing protein [Terrarubrum flagellatum]|uniref:J domain-containing protein n=1 Tax=Terrirubrum flagellatum TaxID=2895980 RepID=UPI0031455E16